MELLFSCSSKGVSLFVSPVYQLPILSFILYNQSKPLNMPLSVVASCCSSCFSMSWSDSCLQGFFPATPEARGQVSSVCIWSSEPVSIFGQSSSAGNRFVLTLETLHSRWLQHELPYPELPNPHSWLLEEFET